ncbi:MAG: hypothetical protein U5M51_04720 [Emticicia sp.]|nr:hypothetical protein [Emticicia sp.]
MQFELQAKIVINVESSNILGITTSFLQSLAPIFATMVSMVMFHYRDEYEKKGRIPFLLGLEAGASWSWKSKQGYNTIVINSLFGKVILPNPVVKIKRKDGSKSSKVLGRKLLEVSPFSQIPDFMKELLGTLGGLMSFRNVEKSMKVFGIFKVSLGSIWCSLQWSAKALILKIKECDNSDNTEQSIVLETDGTGVASSKSGKRGSEIKVLMQRKAGKGLCFLGVKVGKYSSESDWKCLFDDFKKKFSSLKKTVKNCTLVADGDSTVIDVFNTLSIDAVKTFQRCLWHIPHQMKYMLWKDKVDVSQKKEILALTYNAFLLRKSIRLEEFENYICIKLARIEVLIEKCKNLGFFTCATFLKNAKKILLRLVNLSKIIEILL